MDVTRGWRILYFVLLAGFTVATGLNLLDVRGGFLTNHLADLVVPAWLYVVSRGLHSPRAAGTLLRRTVGRTPELAAATLFTASALTEVSQRYWPHGLFPGRFDPLDVLAYALGLAACYGADRLSGGVALKEA
jgi:hypothetical protein